jgi:hypothetical protein
VSTAFKKLSILVRLTETRGMESVLVLLHDDVDHNVRAPSKIEDSRWEGASDGPYKESGNAIAPSRRQ